jgi:hypothetical protein
VNKISQALYMDQQRRELIARPNGLLRWLADNGVAVGAIIAGIVGLLSFLNTRAASYRQEQENQLYESLKRLADPDSPMMRAGAAGLLVSLATGNPLILKTLGLTKVVPVRLRTGLFSRLFEQLCIALLLERDEDVVTAMERAVVAMLEKAWLHSKDLYNVLHLRVKTIQSRLKAESLIDAVAIVEATLGPRSAEGPIARKTLEVIASRTGIELRQLDELVNADAERIDGLRLAYVSAEPKDRFALRQTAYNALDSFRVALARLNVLASMTLRVSCPPNE